MSKDNYLVVCKCLFDVVSLRDGVILFRFLRYWNDFYDIVNFVTETGKDQFTKLFMKK